MRLTPDAPPPSHSPSAPTPPRLNPAKSPAVQVLDSIGIDVAAGAASAPKGKAALQRQQEQEQAAAQAEEEAMQAEADALTARLANLRG